MSRSQSLSLVPNCRPPVSRSFSSSSFVLSSKCGSPQTLFSSFLFSSIKKESETAWLRACVFGAHRKNRLVFFRVVTRELIEKSLPPFFSSAQLSMLLSASSSRLASSFLQHTEESFCKN